MSPSAEPAVRCRGLTKVFRDFWLRPRVVALEDLDLDVAPGEVVGLLGPNGSGKSTTVKLLLGLLFPTRGEVRVLGKEPRDLESKHRIGYLPEESYLYPFLDARETLDFCGRLFGIDRRRRRRRVGLLLRLVGLEEAERRPVGEYSKGMQRRLGVAQALVNLPDLLILDEPTSGLDPLGTREVKDLVSELRRRGKTVLLSSHLLADVEDVCTRVAILYQGRLRGEGPAASLVERSDLQLIECESLGQETLDKVRRAIEADGKALRRVTAGRERLESLFLRTVGAAREGGGGEGAALDRAAIAAILDELEGTAR